MPSHSDIGWLDDLVEAVRRLHDDIITASPGSVGEHTERLIASCARPFQTVLGEPAYPDHLGKAAALSMGSSRAMSSSMETSGPPTLAAMLFLVATGTCDKPTRTQVRLLGEIATITASTGMDVDEVADWFRRILLP